MIKFSKIVENSGFKVFKVVADIELLIKAETDGEAGYVADSILGNISEQIDFKINNIQEASPEESQKLSLESMLLDKIISQTDWVTKNNQLVKTFQFENFKGSIKFINQIAEVSELINHHPEIINTHSKVTIKLSTKDKGNKVTEIDRRMSKKIDALTHL